VKKLILFAHTLIIMTLTLSPAFAQDAEYLFKHGTRSQKIASLNLFMREHSNISLMVGSLKNESEDIYIRKYILHALTVFKDSRSAKNAVIWALEGENEALKQSAAIVASNYKLRDFLYPLLSALANSKNKTKVNALFSLSRIGNLEVLPYLKKYLRSRNPLIRYHARKACNAITNRFRSTPSRG
jgi:hypothetical protein